MICPRCNKEIPDDAVLCCYCARVIQKKKPSNKHQRPNGTGSAFKKGKSWYADVTKGWTTNKDGKRVQNRIRKGGFKTRTEALAYCAVLLEEGKKKKAPCLNEYWELYSRCEMNKLSNSKYTAYTIAWGKLKDLHFRQIDGLTVADLRQVVKDKASSYYTARDMKTVLSHLFELGAADGWCSKDLPSFIVLPELNETPREPFTEEEQVAIWRAYEAGCADAAIPLIMIYTGMMTGEMRKLTMEMIDFDKRQIHDVGLKTKVRKKAVVYLPKDILPVLLDATEGKTGKVWKYNTDNFYKHYYNALEIAGVRRLTPYSCRHTTATALAIDEKIAPETVRKIMRWSTTAMLSRYAHPADKDALEAVDKLTRKE